MVSSDSKPSNSEYINHEPTYHSDKASQYILPNDSPEHVRLETQARHLAAIMNGQIVHSPLKGDTVKRLLDVGCGTGIVTDYLATQYPHADVLGLDLSPVPNLRHRPANVKFLQGNILTDEPAAWKASAHGSAERERLPRNQAFDFIFSRLLVCGMSAWPRYIETEYALLRPGGYAEVHDVDWIWYKSAATSSSGKEEVLSDTWPWWQTLRSAGEANGLDFACASRARGWMADAGFQDIKAEMYRWPFGGQWESDPVWRDFGDYVCSAMVEMVWHMIPRLMTKASEMDIEHMRAAMKRDFAPEEGKFWKFYATSGRKPG